MKYQIKTFLILTFWVNTSFAQINSEKDPNYNLENLTNAAGFFAPKSDTIITYGLECAGSSEFKKFVLVNYKGLWKMYTYSEMWKFHERK
jgi:hypothetical protein